MATSRRACAARSMSSAETSPPASSVLFITRDLFLVDDLLACHTTGRCQLDVGRIDGHVLRCSLLLTRLLVVRHHACHIHQLIALIQGHYANTLRGTPNDANLVDALTVHDTLARDEHQLVRIRHALDRDHLTGLLVDAEVDHAHAAARL